MTIPPFTYTWVEPGKILIGSIPSTPQDIDTLVSMGVRSILTLTQRAIDTYPGVMDSLNAHSMFLRHFPIPDGGVPEKSINPVLEYIAVNYNRNQPVYVHCRGGIGRSGIILQAYYCFYHGKTIEQARDLLRVRRNYEGNATAADQGSPQREWLEQLVSQYLGKTE